MGNEKYLNYYVEILTGTMTDAVIRNISLQANARVTEEVVKDQVKRNEDLIHQVNNLNDEIKKLKESNQQSENTKITDLENKVKGHLDRIGDLERQLNDLNKMKGEYENVKHQVSHVETFRNELNKERENHQKTRDEYENIIRNLDNSFQTKISDLSNSYQSQLKELNEKIEYLQLTPAKRKKIDEEKNKQVEVEETSSALPLEDLTKDGGIF
jgi:chromosome segregation ATPase